MGSSGSQIETPAAQEREVFHSSTRSVCPQCRRMVDGQRILRDGKVFLRKHCPGCGPSEALISSDADWFLDSLTCITRGSRPWVFSTEEAKGCPADCGLCPSHEQHSCLPIIEITNHCNLECPICLVRNRHDYNITRAEFTGILDGLIEKEGTLDTINISGGEPTMHPEFLTLLDLARRPEISRVSVSTNGLRCAASPDFCHELARRGVYINLQVDALEDQALQTLRGGGDQAKARRLALDNLSRAGVRTTLVCTVAEGVNDQAVGDCVRLLLENDSILSLMFQPAAYTGRGAGFAPHNPLDIMTIPGVVQCIEEQTGGLLRRGDFLPLPCSHPSCFGLTYLLKVDDAYIPFPRFIELDRYLGLVSNRGTIRPDADFEDAIRETIDRLWTSAAQIPDSERILSTLKQAIHLMYPRERALELEERIRIGEGLVKTVFIHAFMDEHTFDVERIRKCCTHYALPDGRLMPGCAYNVIHRHREAR